MIHSIETYNEIEKLDKELGQLKANLEKITNTNGIEQWVSYFGGYVHFVESNNGVIISSDILKKYFLNRSISEVKSYCSNRLIIPYKLYKYQKIEHNKYQLDNLIFIKENGKWINLLNNRGANKQQKNILNKLYEKII